MANFMKGSFLMNKNRSKDPEKGKTQVVTALKKAQNGAPVPEKAEPADDGRKVFRKRTSPRPFVLSILFNVLTRTSSRAFPSVFCSLWCCWEASACSAW